MSEQNVLRHYLTGRRGVVILSAVIVAAGVALSWNWLAAAGIAPISASARAVRRDVRARPLHEQDGQVVLVRRTRDGCGERYMLPCTNEQQNRIVVQLG